MAARYDEDDAGMFAPAVVGPAVDFLAGLAGEGGRPEPSALEPSALELGSGRRNST